MKKKIYKVISRNRGGQTGDHTRKVNRQQTKSSRIGDPTGCNVEPWNNLAQELRF